MVGGVYGCLGVINVQGSANVDSFFFFFFFKGGHGFGGINSLEGKEGFYVCVQKLQTERRCLV